MTVQRRLPPGFVQLWLAQTCSHLGDAVFVAAVIWSAATRFGPAAAATGVGLALFAPTALLLPVAGVLVDRFSRRHLLIGTDMTRALVTALLGTMLLSRPLSLPLLLASVVTVRATGVLFAPSMHALLGEVIEGDTALLRVDSWMLASPMIATIAGPFLAGVMIGYGLGIALLFDAVTFGISLLGLHLARTLIAVPGHRRPARAHVLAEARQGLETARRDPIVGRLAPTFPLIDLVASAVSLTLPALLLQRGVIDPRGYGLLVAAWAAGRFGGLLLLKIPWVSTYRGALLAVNCAVQGLLIGGVGLAHSPVAMGLLFLLLGLPSGATSVCVHAYIQTRIPNEQRGRVFALLQAVVTVVVPFGPVIAGWLMGWAAPDLTVLILGAALLLAGLRPLTSRVVWRWRVTPAAVTASPATAEAG